MIQCLKNKRFYFLKKLTLLGKAIILLTNPKVSPRAFLLFLVIKRIRGKLQKGIKEC